ncbi:unnamed protein product [Strongylus vulgaris]|uniref:Uncharacterized protein n=1 Tax=Strongylus vulgaris TaxID=40348 RepID=A0A3P7IT30_STRVU|nr:unnamed protein product [Strongylus vulgaris]
MRIDKMDNRWMYDKSNALLSDGNFSLRMMGVPSLSGTPSCLNTFLGRALLYHKQSLTLWNGEPPSD